MSTVRKVDDPAEFAEIDGIDLDDIDAITEYEAESIAVMADSVIETFTDIGASAASQEFIQALFDNNLAGSETFLAWDQLVEIADTLEGMLTEQIRAGAVEAIRQLPETPATIRYSFDASNPLAVEVARSRAAKYIRDITEEQRALVRQIVVDAVSGGYTVDDVAFMVRNSVGLHERWQRAVTRQYGRNLADLLAQGIPAGRARTLARRSNAAYYDRLLTARGRAIARTEILSAHNEGRWLAWQDAIRDGVAPTNAMKMWRVRVPQVPDSPCDYCLPFNGETVPWDDEFSAGVLMPPLHPNCVCTATLVFPDDAEYVSGRL